MSMLFPGLFILDIANAQEANSGDEPVVNFFQGVPAWVWALCFVVLVFVCVGAFCACRHDVMMHTEAEMLSDEKWTDEVFLAMHKCEIPLSPQSENVLHKQLHKKKPAIPTINLTGVFSTANLNTENNKSSGQKKPKRIGVYSDSDMSSSYTAKKMISADSVHSLPKRVCFIENESLERENTNSRKEKKPDFRRPVSAQVVF